MAQPLVSGAVARDARARAGAKSATPGPVIGNRTAAAALQKKRGGFPPCRVPYISADRLTFAFVSR
jgi:hypothetical protein